MNKQFNLFHIVMFFFGSNYISILYSFLNIADEQQPQPSIINFFKTFNIPFNFYFIKFLYCTCRTFCTHFTKQQAVRHTNGQEDSEDDDGQSVSIRYCGAILKSYQRQILLQTVAITPREHKICKRCDKLKPISQEYQNQSDRQGHNQEKKYLKRTFVKHC